MTIARYTFLPWLRRGIANRIQAAAGAGASRATLTVTLTAKSEVAATPIPSAPNAMANMKGAVPGPNAKPLLPGRS